MEPKNQERIERWLDRALAEHGSAEPRPGLESRLLARVRQEQEASARNRRWWPVLVATAVAGALAIGVFIVERPAKAPVVPPTNANRATDHALSAAERQQNTAHGASRGRTVGKDRAPKGRQSSFTTARAEPMPKLDQFPSPQPLSEQERLLARYVKDFPEEARMIAQAQAEYEREIRRKMGEPAESSYQEER